MGAIYRVIDYKDRLDGYYSRNMIVDWYNVVINSGERKTAVKEIIEILEVEHNIFINYIGDTKDLISLKSSGTGTLNKSYYTPRDLILLAQRRYDWAEKKGPSGLPYPEDLRSAMMYLHQSGQHIGFATSTRLKKEQGIYKALIKGLKPIRKLKETVHELMDEETE